MFGLISCTAGIAPGLVRLAKNLPFTKTGAARRGSNLAITYGYGNTRVAFAQGECSKTPPARASRVTMAGRLPVWAGRVVGWAADRGTSY
jgi:hypothetical protein